MKSTPKTEYYRFKEAKNDFWNFSEGLHGECSFEVNDNYCDIHFSQHGNGIIMIDTENSGDNMDTVQAALEDELVHTFESGTYCVMQNKTNIIAFVEADEIDCAERLANIAYCAASRVHWNELDEAEESHYNKVV